MACKLRLLQTLSFISLISVENNSSEQFDNGILEIFMYISTLHNQEVIYTPDPLGHTVSWISWFETLLGSIHASIVVPGSGSSYLFSVMGYC